MENLIHELAPYLEACQDTTEAKRVEMCLIWGIEPRHHGAIYDYVECRKHGLYTSDHAIICRIHDYLKTRNYF